MATKTKETETVEAPATTNVQPIQPATIGVPKQLSTQEIQPEGIKWTRWAVVCNAEHTIEDCLHPLYLYAKGEQFKACDYVEIKHPFGYFTVCLDVVRVDHRVRGIEAHIRHIFDYRLSEAKIKPDTAGAQIQKLGDREWSIIIGHHVVADNFATREAAEKWLSEQRAA
jgi:hypothetical protein